MSKLESAFKAAMALPNKEDRDVILIALLQKYIEPKFKNNAFPAWVYDFGIQYCAENHDQWMEFQALQKKSAKAKSLTDQIKKYIDLHSHVLKFAGGEPRPYSDAEVNRCQQIFSSDLKVWDRWITFKTMENGYYNNKTNERFMMNQLPSECLKKFMDDIEKEKEPVDKERVEATEAKNRRLALRDTVKVFQWFQDIGITLNPTIPDQGNSENNRQMVTVTTVVIKNGAVEKNVVKNDDNLEAHPPKKAKYGLDQQVVLKLENFGDIMTEENAQQHDNFREESFELPMVPPCTLEQVIHVSENTTTEPISADFLDA